MPLLLHLLTKRNTKSDSSPLKMQSGKLPSTSSDKMAGKGVSDVAAKPAAAAIRIVRKRKNFSLEASSSSKEKKKKIEKKAVENIIPGNAVVVKKEEGLPSTAMTLGAGKQQADGEAAVPAADAEKELAAAAGLKELEELRAKAEADANLKELRAKAEADAKFKELRAKFLASERLKVELRDKAEADAKLKELRAKAEADAKLKEVKANTGVFAKLMERVRVKAEAEAKLNEELRAKAEADAKLKEELRAKAEADAKLKADEDKDKENKAAAEDTLFLLKLKKHKIVETLSSQHQSSPDPAINPPLSPAQSRSVFTPPVTGADIPGPSSPLSVEEELILLRREVQEMKGIERALNKDMGSMIDRVYHLEKDNKYY